MTVREYCKQMFGIDTAELLDAYRNDPFEPNPEWNPTPKELYREVKSLWKSEMQWADSHDFGYSV